MEGSLQTPDGYVSMDTQEKGVQRFKYRLFFIRRRSTSGSRRDDRFEGHEQSLYGVQYQYH